MEQNKDDILRTFGNKIRVFRIKEGFSQEELGDRAGLDRSYIGGVERGERNISLINIFKLAKGLGLAPKRLLED